MNTTLALVAAFALYGTLASTNPTWPVGVTVNQPATTTLEIKDTVGFVGPDWSTLELWLEDGSTPQITTTPLAIE